MATSPRVRPLRHRPVLLIALFAFVAALLPGQQVRADQHGIVRSFPEPDSIVAVPPAELFVEFDGQLVPERVELFAVGPSGNDIAAGAARVEGAIATLPVDDQVPDGIYRFSYNVVVRDDSGGPSRSYDGTIRYNLSTTGCEARIRTQDQYTSIQAPDFASPPQVMTGAVADKTFMNLLYATNGRVLHRSADKGCTWEVALDLGALAQADQSRDAVIAEVLTPREVPGMVVALVLDPVDGTGLVQPRIFSTMQLGGALLEGGTGLPALRFDPSQPLRCRHPQPCDLKVSDASMTIPSVYLAAETVPDLGLVSVLRSDDAGANFTLASMLVPDLLERVTSDLDPVGALTSPTAFVKAATISPDPEQPDWVWVSTGQAIHVSTDRGQSFSPAHRIEGGEGRVITRLEAGLGLDDRGVPRRDVLATISADELTAPIERFQRFVVAGLGLVEGQAIDVSELGPAWVESVVRGPQADQFLLLPERGDKVRPGAWEYESALGVLLDLDSFDLTPWRGATWTNPLCSRWLAHDDGHLYLVDADDGHAHAHDAGAFCDPDPEALDGNALGIVKFPKVDVPLDGTTEIAPRNHVVHVKPGEFQSVAFGLARAAEDTPVDIAFLFDSSGSMRDNVEQVREAFATIVDTLRDREVDAWFGLAEFNDWAMRYRRLADIGAPEAGFSRALSEFQVGSGDREPHLTALHQLATGSGVGPVTQGAPVRPGLEMNWRPDALRIVLMASDEPITDDPDGASFDEAVASLNGKDIKHIGLHIPEEVGSANNSVPSADNPAGVTDLKGQMQELSRATGAFASRGVDCNGDGVDDVHLGEPLVCTLGNDVGTNSGVAAPRALALAISDLVDAVDERRTFRLDAPTTTGFVADLIPVLGGIGGGIQLDVTLEQRPRWIARVGCFQNAEGRRSDVPVSGYMERKLLVRTTLTIVCGDQAGLPPPVDRAPAVAVALAVPAPVAPPAPIPANAPASAAQAANAQAAAQASAQAPAAAAAVAPQMATQSQKAEIRRDDDDGYSFSAVRSRDESPALTLAAGFVMAAGVGASQVRRRQSSAQHVHVRRH